MDFVYLDNAATTWPKPPEVYEAADMALRQTGANPGRSSHRMSVEAEKIVQETRLLAAKLLGAPSPEHVIFTLNCTDSLNIAIKGLLGPNDRVVTTSFEHNSVMRPLRRLACAGLDLRIARATPDYQTDLEDFQRLCSQGLSAAIVTHASNVTGYVHPIAEMSKAVHDGGGIMIVDAAQTAGRERIDMRGMGIDILAAPGHKGLYGPMGVGLLILGEGVSLRPFREGGTGFRSEEDLQPVELPYALEAGTPNLPGIAGLRAGLRFVLERNPESIAAVEYRLAEAAAEGLASIPGVSIFLPDGKPQGGIVSFVTDDLDVSLVGTLLDETFSIRVRSGLHCAPAAHRAIGTFPAGTVRVSLGAFNTKADVDSLVEAVRQIST